MTTPTTDEAPPASEEALTIPAVEPTGDFYDATDAHEVTEFPERTEEEREAAQAPSPPEDGAAQADPAVPAEATEDEFDEAQFEKLAKHPKGKERLDRLAANRFGNEKQRLRQEVEREFRQSEAEWNESTEYYRNHTQQLRNNPDYARAFQESNAPEVIRLRDWVNRYQIVEGNRRAALAEPEPVDATALQEQVFNEFNTMAVTEFGAVVKASLPFFDELPQSLRDEVLSGDFDPNADNWFADRLGKVLTAVNKRHDRALAEAKNAGRNAAFAEREDGMPVVATASQGEDAMTDREIVQSHAFNGYRYVTQAQVKAAHKRLGLNS